MPKGVILEERGRIDTEEPGGWKFLKVQIWGNEGGLGRGGEVSREGSKLLPEGQWTGLHDPWVCQGGVRKDV